MDIENLVTALGDESPSGPDLSYDSGRQEIEAAFEAASAEGSDDAEIDWRGTIKLIIAQAEVTRDLWLPDVFGYAAETDAGVLAQEGARPVTTLLELIPVLAVADAEA